MEFPCRTVHVVLTGAGSGPLLPLLMEKHCGTFMACKVIVKAVTRTHFETPGLSALPGNWVVRVVRGTAMLPAEQSRITCFRFTTMVCHRSSRWHLQHDKDYGVKKTRKENIRRMTGPGNGEMDGAAEQPWGGSFGSHVLKAFAISSLATVAWNYRYVLWSARFDSGVQLIRNSREPTLACSGISRCRGSLSSPQQCDSLFMPGREKRANGSSAAQVLLEVHLQSKDVRLQHDALHFLAEVLEIDGPQRLRHLSGEQAIAQASPLFTGKSERELADSLVAKLRSLEN
jgi:hypothetical protein